MNPTLPQSAAVEPSPELDFTVVIPTYNGAHRLPAVLDRLQSQQDISTLRWEIVVVDNNSSDHITTVIQEYQALQPANCTLRYATELRQGAGYARQTAIQLAQSELIGFLDDDNLPASDWIAAAIAFAQAHPQAGAVGSHIEADYELTPPPEFQRIQPFFALTDLGPEARLYQQHQRLLPPTAGLVVRKTAWLTSVPDHCILTGRTPTSILTGEDLEVVSHIQAHHWEIWHNPAMRITHCIPQRRLQRDYLLPFMTGIGLSRHVTRMMSLPRWQRPLFVVVFWASDLRRLIWHGLRYGGRSRTDLVVACETSFLLGCLMSPFYIWGKLYRQERG